MIQALHEDNILVYVPFGPLLPTPMRIEKSLLLPREENKAIQLANAALQSSLTRVQRAVLLDIELVKTYNRTKSELANTVLTAH